MLTKEKRNQIIRTLRKLTQATLDKYRATLEQADELLKKSDNANLPCAINIAVSVELGKLFAQSREAWNAHLSASKVEEAVYDMPYVVTDGVFGERIIYPTIATATEDEELSALSVQDEALSA